VAKRYAGSAPQLQGWGGKEPAANTLAMYYMGRLDSFSFPREQSKRPLSKSYPVLKTRSFSRLEAGRCGKALMDKGQILTLIGTNLTQTRPQQLPTTLHKHRRNRRPKPRP